MKQTLAVFVMIVASMAMIGCGASDDTTSAAAKTTDTATGSHAHTDNGPHGGHLVDLDGYRVEVTTDQDSHTVTLYLLDEQANELAAVDATAATVSVFKDGEFVDYSLKAANEPGVFSLTDEELSHLLDHSEDVKARVKVTIDGQEQVAKYEHEAHDEDDGHEH